LINKVEEAERLLLAAEPDRKLFHLSIINLVIGSQSINQSINILLLRHDKMQASNSKQERNTVSKNKSLSR